MRTYHLAGIAAVALALGATGAGAQGSDQQQQGAGAETEQAHNAGLIALDEQKQTRVSQIIQQQRIKPATNVNFSLSVAATVPSSVRLSPISGELADIFPNYRDFSFFVARQELVIVDPQSHAIVGFAPIAGGGAVAAAPPRQDAGAVGAAEPPPPAKKDTPRTRNRRATATQEKPETTNDTVGAASPGQNAGAAGATEPPAPARKNTRTRNRRVTEAKPEAPEPEALPRGPARTDRDVTVGASRRDGDAFYPPPPPPPRDRVLGPPVRERVERDPGPPFPFSLLFGRWN